MIESIAHYRIEAEIGRGGMGVVYRAVDTRLRRAVAIKVLPPEATADAERVQRFVHEARAASALNHPNIVTIYDIGADAGTAFIAMELVDGTPLDTRLARGPLPVAEALDYASQIASALEVAHASGIIHRDIKPANIVLARDGRAKVLDFGLAKLLERTAGPDESTVTSLGTRAGTIMGTLAYMSPEQAEGRPVDARSDLFSFGAVLYEMLTGTRPFTSGSTPGLIAAILRDQPTPIPSLRADVPAGVEVIVERCLAKDPAARYANAGGVKAALDAERAPVALAARAPWARPAVLLPVAVVLVALAAFGAWQAVRAQRVRWVQREAIPEIERLSQSGHMLDAVRLARRAERFAPDDIASVRQSWRVFEWATDPPGAEIQFQDYLDTGEQWEVLGVTPVHTRLPFASYRVRIAKQGFLPLEITWPGPAWPSVKLAPESAALPGMVPVAGGPYDPGVAGAVTLPDFWIDRCEVTNREFKKFVDAGGYRDAKYWQEPFRDGSRTLGFEEAMARFRDTTGRSGPATWELGSYPEGQADFPVGGISWFESAAVAEFAGKSLPTIYHWYKAAGPEEIFADILQRSNFGGKGPVKAGELHGLGRWGTLDMAGNVKEWCSNLAQGTNLRYILGGGWDEPSYRYMEPDARDPWDRLPAFGVRLVKTPGPVAEAAAPVARVYGDPKSVVPVADELFEAYRSFYAYDRAPLNARNDGVDDTSPYWRRESISFDAAYGGERVPAQLFLPKNAAPPYQTVVLFPSFYAVVTASSENLDTFMFDFIVRSGRAVLYPVYQGTFERRGNQGSGPSAVRDMQVQRAKDFFRAVDYLETRQDIDLQRLAYYSLSMGAYFGPVPVSLEPRIKVAVFVSGGLRFNYPPEIQPANFAPHMKVPVLLVNGRDDFQAPLEAQQRLYDLLGTAPEHKKHVVLDGGHVPSDVRGMMREVLDWMDRYLGAVG